MRMDGWMRAGALLSGVWLAGCSSFGQPAKPPTIYDIVPLTDEVRRFEVPISRLEVHAPSWLASSAMQYRLVPVSPLERHIYATSRWAGMPAEMLESVFGRIIQTQPAANGSGCRLRVDLDEFIQHFESTDRSVGRIEMRVSLLSPRTDVLVAYRAFTLERPAPSADAAGGVEALREAVSQLGLGVAQWLDTLENGDSRQNTVMRCSQ